MNFGKSPNTMTGRALIAAGLVVAILITMLLSRRNFTKENETASVNPSAAQIRQQPSLEPSKPNLEPPRVQTTLNEVAAPGCHLFRFKHRHPGKGDIGSSHYSNELIVPGATLSDIACLRVDGDSVAYERKGNLISFQAQIHPDSTVSLVTCHGTPICAQERCGERRHDRFLAAIGASGRNHDKVRSQEGGKKGRDSKWDPSDPEHDQDVTAQIPRELLSDEEESPRLNRAVIRNWTVSRVERACGKSVALKD